MRKALPFLAVAASLGLPLACDFEKTGNQLTARRVMVGTLLSTPSVDISPAAMAGFDAGFAPDAGFGLDGGGLTVPGHIGAFVFFGERTGESLEAIPNGITGATVTVGAAGGTRTPLKAEGAGTYSAADEPTLKYEPGKPYEFSAGYQGEGFIGRVERAPQVERIAAFHPPRGFVEHARGASFSFTRQAPPAGQPERTLGFVTVFPVSGDGDRGEPTYTNVPKTPVDFLKLMAFPTEWRSASVAVPGMAFPQAGRTFVVVFQTVESGGPESENLFAGSAILVGTADVAVVHTR